MDASRPPELNQRGCLTGLAFSEHLILVKPTINAIIKFEDIAMIYYSSQKCVKTAQPFQRPGPHLSIRTVVRLFVFLMGIA